MQIKGRSIYFWSRKILIAPYRLMAKGEELSAIDAAERDFEKSIKTPPMTKTALKSRIDDLASPSLVVLAIAVPLFLLTPILIAFGGPSLVVGIPYYLGLYAVGLTVIFAVRIGFAQRDYFRFKKWIKDKNDPDEFVLSDHTYICSYDFLIAILIAVGLGTLLPI